MTECVKIKCDDCKFVENCVDYGWQECKKFTHKPSEPMTNEEWLRQCTTMELAEFIRKQRDDWSDGWYSDCHRFEEIVEWLKEIHE